MSVTVKIIPMVIREAKAWEAYNNGEELNNSDRAWEKYKRNNNVKAIQTSFKDEELLRRALEKCDNPDINGSGVLFETQVGGFQMVFQKTEAGFFEVQYIYEVDEEGIRNQIERIKEEYNSLIQEDIYNKVIAKAEEKGLTLEKESYQKDQTIVLTFNING